MGTESPKTLFSLPLEDIVVDNVGKYLDFGDIYKFGKCSKDCKALADSMAATKSKLYLTDDFDHFDIPEEQLPDFMSWMSQNCRNLKKIVVFTYIWPHNHFLIQLLKNNHQLERFCACSFEESNHRGIIPLLPLATSTKLIELTLVHFNVHNKFLTKLSENSHQLRHIKFSWSTGFSEDVLLNFLKKQPDLEYIDLTSCAMKISDLDAFISVIKNSCPKLESLNISDVKGVKKTDISKIKEKLAKDPDYHFRLSL